MSELALPPLASTAAYPEQAFERPGSSTASRTGSSRRSRGLQARKA
jgi:hypothetical protein